MYDLGKVSGLYIQLKKGSGLCYREKDISGCCVASVVGLFLPLGFYRISKKHFIDRVDSKRRCEHSLSGFFVCFLTCERLPGDHHLLIKSCNVLHCATHFIV